MDGLAAEVPEEARKLAEAFWPGALTLICHAQPSLSWDLGDTLGTVALRMPDHKLALDLLTITGPLAVSSANRTGAPAAQSAAAAREQLGESVEVYLEDAPRDNGIENGTPNGNDKDEAEGHRDGAVPEDAVVPGSAATDAAVTEDDGAAPADAVVLEDAAATDDAEVPDDAGVLEDAVATGDAGAPALPSTIVDATGGVLRVVRLGAISLERLRSVAPSVLGPVEA
jgi:tRNA A37 threonylcarbamoyladenosine synthetase subunit TsaC/SUA5/YrdC